MNKHTLKSGLLFAVIITVTGFLTISGAAQVFAISTNHEPTLSYSPDTGYINDGINPDVGFTNTNFTFKIIYTDQDNDPPTNLLVVVYNGGTATSTLFMSPDTDASVNPTLRDENYRNGEQYMAISTFSKGNYSYVFQTRDINNAAVLFPITTTPTFTVSFGSSGGGGGGGSGGGGGGERTPVVLIPGIIGSYLNRVSDDGAVWPNAPIMALPGDDNYLDELKLDKTGAEFFGKEIYAKDAIRHIFFPITYDYFAPLIKSFTDAGFVEGIDLFVAPNDWRLDIKTSARAEDGNKLHDVIQNAIGNSPNGKINVIAHSLGGLIMKEYIKNRGDEFINKLIFVGVPHLGAPKALKVLQYGDDMGLSKLELGLNENKVKEITQNMPGVYQLLPSRTYLNIDSFESTNYVRDFRNGANKNLTYDETTAFMLENPNDTRNSLLLTGADVFHADSDSLEIYKPNYYHIVSCSNYTTIKSIQLYDENKFDVGTGKGDGTVPLKSTTKTSVLALPRDENVYYVLDGTISHDGLMSNQETDALMHAILDGTTLTQSSTSANPDDCSPTFSSATNYGLSTHSPVQLHVYDDEGNHTGINQQGDIELGIPQSDYMRLGEDSFVFVPAGKEYRIVIDALSDGFFDLKVKTYKGEEIATTTTFLHVPLQSASTTAEVMFDGGSESMSLALDANGDGTIDTHIPQTAILTGRETLDITPPVITMPAIPEKIKIEELAKRKITLAYDATDDISGVSSLAGVLDGKEVKSGDAIIICTPGKHVLRVTAVDRAGNPRNAEVMFDVMMPFWERLSDYFGGSIHPKEPSCIIRGSK